MLEVLRGCCCLSDPIPSLMPRDASVIALQAARAVRLITVVSPKSGRK